MLIECNSDPDDIIDNIGDRFFSILSEEDMRDIERLSECAIIRDCEDGVRIEISSEYGKAENFKIAEALVLLLNQEYDFIPAGTR